MSELRLTLLGDGPSDRALLPIVLWAIAQHSNRVIVPQFADLRLLPSPPTLLPARVAMTLEVWPCDLLCVHRDAEKQDPELRYREISQATPDSPPHVPVVPVRMQEAWLLHDESAIRQAAGRPNGTEPLALPASNRVESLPDPKAVLHAALRQAHAATGRRARKFSPKRAVYEVAELIDDWSPLRQLAAFQRFEVELVAALERCRPE